jgi:small-conductance mechanosensitive channel
MDFHVVIDALTKVLTDIIDFIPRLINGLIILIIGYLIAWLVRGLLRVVLRSAKFDPLVERTGITGTLRGLGVRKPLSQIVVQTVFVLLLLSFLITSTRLMGLEAVARVLEQVLTFLPNLIAALVVFLLGGIVAKFVGDMIARVGTEANLGYAGRVGRLVQYLISVFVVVIALGVLGLDTGILVTALTIGIAAFGLALGLALGLGARNTVQHILAGYYTRQRFAVGRPIVFNQARGEISSIGSVNTVVATADGDLVIPNALLIESVVQAPRPVEPPPPPQP